jgi:DNA-binding GntR family transcriptional regulator
MARILYPAARLTSISDCMNRRSASDVTPTPPAPYTPVVATPRPSGAPIQRQTIASMTVEALRERILRGVYPEGEPLRQDALADELGVSRIPVREALRQLEAEGLVTFSPHRGAVVSSLSLDEIDELFELRADIECDLLRRAIPKMSPEQLERAVDVLDEFQDALVAGEATRWGPLNWHFHAALYAPANRNFTMGVLQKLHQHSDRYFRMQVLLAHGGVRANNEHREITTAVQERDIERACDLMRAHILGAGSSLLELLPEHRNGTNAARAQAAAR